MYSSFWIKASAKCPKCKCEPLNGTKVLCAKKEDIFKVALPEGIIKHGYRKLPRVLFLYLRSTY